jgi:hypothetical protein
MTTLEVNVVCKNLDALGLEVAFLDHEPITPGVPHLPKESERRNAKGDCIFEQSSW